MAEPVDAGDLRRELCAQYLDERGLREPPKGFDEQELFAFHVERCLHTVTTGHGDPEPRHRIWNAP